MSSKQSLDHLILFVPADRNTKLPLVPSVFEKNFTLTPGGIHADGITSNTLILLSDGCYIELISFIDSAKAASHWWGPDANFVGWKDWCLTNSKSPEENHEDIKKSHDAPIRGGRKRADGVDVSWAVTFPKGAMGGQDVRGRVPFFCHDVTPRSVRVPLSAEKTTHACGALGVQQLSIIVKDQGLLDETRHVYANMFGTDGIARGNEVNFQAGRVNDVEDLSSGPRIELRLPKDKKEFEATMKTGYHYGDVVIATRAGAGKGLGSRQQLDVGGNYVEGLWLEYV